MKLNRALYINDMGLPSVGIAVNTIKYSSIPYRYKVNMSRILRFVTRSKLITVTIVLAIDAVFVLAAMALFS
jgi:hypothetical protein